ncbi:MAG: hypothetical protein GVY22_07315 [Gammaproteobacteria bacterium]|jgi:hypothetical protein|nr:hypothetical protein [Gammaproteobacteria bacterium]
MGEVEPGQGVDDQRETLGLAQEVGAALGVVAVAGDALVQLGERARGEFSVGLAEGGLGEVLLIIF